MGLFGRRVPADFRAASRPRSPENTGCGFLHERWCPALFPGDGRDACGADDLPAHIQPIMTLQRT